MEVRKQLHSIDKTSVVHAKEPNQSQALPLRIAEVAEVQGFKLSDKALLLFNKFVEIVMD